MAGTSQDEGRIPTYTMLLNCLTTKTRILTFSDRVEHVRRPPLGGSCTDGWGWGCLQESQERGVAGTSRDEGRIPTYTMLLDCLATKTRILTFSEKARCVRHTSPGGSSTYGWGQGCV